MSALLNDVWCTIPSTHRDVYTVHIRSGARKSSHRGGVPSRPMQRTTRRTTKTQRERILDAADAQFRRGGLGAISIRRIAGDVGLSPMAIYRHYENKDELV